MTVLAGLLVLALLAALIGPGFVDWRAYRPQIEARLGSALGVETHVAGGIGLRLLPSPRMTLGDVRIGDAEGAASAVTVERVSVELALSALMRGEFRFSHAAVEGATVSLVADGDGAIRLPRRSGAGLPTQTSLDGLSVSRSAIIWREEGKAPVTLAPVAVELSAASLAGPWRIEGEVAGVSLRLATGAIEPDGRLRSKASVIGEDSQVSFDGSLLLPSDGAKVVPGLDGAFSLVPGGAVSLAGRVTGGGRQLDLSGLTLDIAGGAARLEGEGQYRPAEGAGSLALRARRVDADALLLALEQRPGFGRSLQALPGALDIGIDLDQLVWRGEDIAAVALRGALSEQGLTNASASLRVAGALVGASGSVGLDGLVGRLNLKADDARRVALVLARGGLDPSIADLVSGLGRIDAEAVGAWSADRLRLERLVVTGASGMRLEGSGEIAADALSAKATLHGLDLNTLPPAESLSGLLGARNLTIDLALERARFRNAPPGAVRLDLRREGASWRLSRLSVDGFGGVAVTGAGALLPEGGEISGRVRAPRFEALAALAGPLLPDAARQSLARIGEGLSTLDAGYRLTRATGGETALTAQGSAQAGRLAFDGRIDPAGVWTQGGLRFDLGDRRQVFAALGLPMPAAGGAGQLVVQASAGRLTGSLAGPGLSLVVEGGGPELPQLTLQADGPGQVLPEGPARLLPDGVMDAHGRLRLASDLAGVDDLVVNIAGATARGALTLPRDGPVTGRLALARADLRGVLAAALGTGAPTPGAVWSTTRLGPAPGFGEMALAVEAGTLVVADGVALDRAKFTLQAGAGGLQIGDLTAGHGAGGVTGQLSVRREGGLAQLTGRLGFSQLDLAGITSGSLGGKTSGQIEFGGSGETPARLVAGLSGAGALTLTGASLARFDPAAYARVIATTGEDASESETDRLQRRLSEALDRASWPLGDVTLPFTLAGGLARLQPFSFERAGLRAEASGLVDLRALSADVRLSLRPLGPLPKDWPVSAPQLGVAWRGPLSALRRETDVGALSNAVAARALAREIERVEAFEADARERAVNSRRLRAERETRENERRLGEFLRIEEERRVAEEARRLAEETRRIAEETRRQAEEAKRAEEARRRAEAEDRVRAAAEERARIQAEERQRAAARSQQPGPLVLPGAPRDAFPDRLLAPAEPGNAAPPLGAPLQIEPLPRPLSRRGVQLD